MSAVHTPGPWWTTNSGVRDRGGYICHTNPATRYEGQDERFARESAERAANKLLIAAAPELLAFAQSLVDAWESKEGMPYPYLIASAARAVIAKATGNAPEGFTTLPPAALAAARAFGAGLDDRSLEQPSEVL